MKNYFYVIFALFLLCGCSGKSETESDLTQKAFNAASSADWSSALSYSNRALAVNPSDESAAVINALALEASGDVESAVKRLQTIGSESGNFMALYSLGRILAAQGKYDQAIIPLTQAKELKGDDVNLLMLHAKVSTRLNRADTINVLQKLLESDKFAPDNTAIIWNETAVQCALKNDFSRAVKALDIAIAKSRTERPELFLNYAILLDFQPSLRVRRSEAKRHYEKYLALTENRSDLVRERTLVAERLKSF